MRHPKIRVASGPYATLITLTIILLLSTKILGSSGDVKATVITDPLRLEGGLEKSGALQVRLDPAEYNILKTGPTAQIIEFPISGSESLILEMERLNIIAPNCRYKIGSSTGDTETDPPDVVLYRGYVRDEPSSYAYLAFTGQGSGNGYVRTGNGELYIMSHPASEIGKPDGIGIIIHKATTFGELPEFEEFCRVIDEYTDLPQMGEIRFFADTVGGPRIIGMAIEGDQRFCQIFPDVTAAQNYVVQLIGAVSDIYLRDFNAKVVLSFIRLWPEGGAPFTGYDLYGLRSYWRSNEDLTGINVVQLLSGIRDLDYGGIGFVGGYCGGTFSICGYINGSFPTPVGLSNISSWDLIVSAHEMGHNMMTMHTHDGFDPPIDSCGTLGIRARSTIMSYCHGTPGYTSNIELRFHRLVQQVVEYYMVYFDCLDFDCNNNGADDAQDIALGISQDVNSNGIPDECEDCNNNGTLDNIDIAGGAPDVNNNGIPDECETDCNSNSIPDNYETNLGMAPDLNGNCVPDECDPDCNDNSLPDFWEIKYGYEEDWDNNGIPDVCQDCDENGVADMYDLGKQFNLYVADGSGFIREYNAISGVPIQNMGSGSISSPTDCTFGPDRQLYVTTGNGIDRINVDSATTTTFITSGSGGLITPTFLTFGPGDNLFVSSYGTHCVLEFDGATGAFIDTFVTPNSGGLVAPWGLEFGPNGNLFVAGANNAVYEYSGTDGSFVGIFVTSGSGGLTSPRGIAFAPDGHLLVASQSTSQVLKYDGTTGAFLGVFHDEYNPINPHGVRFGPNGNVYVVQSYNPSNVFEFVYPEGRYYRRFVRNDDGLPSPTGLAFRPASSLDADGNYVIDACDQCLDSDSDGFGDPDQLENTCLPDNCPDDYNPDQLDSDADGAGDACDDCPYDQYNDVDGDGLCGDVDNCPTYPNPGQQDADGDDIGDVCDNCPGEYNPSQEDVDNDVIGDICDNCRYAYNTDQANNDADSLGDACDNCPDDTNDDQLNSDFDSVGDACDNCPDSTNQNQSDVDGDDYGDVCDNCPDIYNPDQIDTNQNGIGDACEFICGDPDGSSSVDMLDILFLISYLYKGGPSPEPMDAADADGSDAVDMLDILYLISYLYKGGQEPVC